MLHFLLIDKKLIVICFSFPFALWLNLFYIDNAALGQFSPPFYVVYNNLIGIVPPLRFKVQSTNALTCLANLVMALGSEMEQYIADLTPAMFCEGLSPSLIDTLVVISKVLIYGRNGLCFRVWVTFEIRVRVRDRIRVWG